MLILTYIFIYSQALAWHWRLAEGAGSWLSLALDSCEATYHRVLTEHSSTHPSCSSRTQLLIPNPALDLLQVPASPEGGPLYLVMANYICLVLTPIYQYCSYRDVLRRILNLHRVSVGTICDRFAILALGIVVRSYKFRSWLARLGLQEECLQNQQMYMPFVPFRRGETQKL